MRTVMQMTLALLVFIVPVWTVQAQCYGPTYSYPVREKIIVEKVKEIVPVAVFFREVYPIYSAGYAPGVPIQLNYGVPPPLALPVAQPLQAQAKGEVFEGGVILQQLKILAAEIAELKQGRIVGGVHVGIAAAKCAKCHDQADSAKEGNGIVLTSGGKLATTDPYLLTEAIDQIRLGKMPKGGVKLTEAEGSELVAEFMAHSRALRTAAAKAPK